MFLVFNKEKIFAYMVSVVTVIFLFFLANSMYGNKESISTSSNLENNLPIYNVETKENNVSLTINCAWNADDIDSILKTLEKENVKATFFITGHYLNSEPELVKKMIEEGHIIGNHTPNYLMSGDDIKVKC